MIKHYYHPKSYLSLIKNVKRGLDTRTKMLSNLETDIYIAKILSKRTGVSYSSVLHHLHLMEKEHIVSFEGRKPHKWRLTGVGQLRLTEI